MTSPKAHAIHYQVCFPHPNEHRYEVNIEVRHPAAHQAFQMASWIPGSYLIREFAKQVHSVSAWQGNRRLKLRMTGKDTWEVENDGSQAITLRYQVMAHDDSVRTAWLDARRGFFNGTSLFMQVLGQTHEPVSLTVEPNTHLPRWRLASSLTPVRIRPNGFGTYQADHFDELVDHPVEMGEFWDAEFETRGVNHRLVVSGATPRFDGDRLLRDTQAICESAIRFWHGRGRPPFDRYVFMLNVLPNGYGGLEHRNSTALVAQHSDLPRRGSANDHEGYHNLLGLISHEYFHTWNVKRLKPAEFSPYDLQSENLTELLWFFEGFTSYFDDVLLVRSGLLSHAQYLARLQKTLTQVEQTPGRNRHTLAQSSFEAWTKYYRPDPQTHNLTVSYYTKGSLVALCWDLLLRSEGHCLDEVMRLLWRKTRGGPMTESDWLHALEAVRGKPCLREHRAWVHGTGELPVHEWLKRHGVGIAPHTRGWAQSLGMRLQGGAGMRISHVLSGSWAARAGFAPGDDWVAIGEGESFDRAWRIESFEDLTTYAAFDRPLKAWVFRRRQGLCLSLPPMKAMETSSSTRLQVVDPDAMRRWLDDAA